VDYVEGNDRFLSIMEGTAKNCTGKKISITINAIHLINRYMLSIFLIAKLKSFFQYLKVRVITSVFTPLIRVFLSIIRVYTNSSVLILIQFYR